MKDRLRTLDLFSGIGGISFALRSGCKTVAYCDNDSLCREILKNNQKKRHIDAAPILEDVQAISKRDLPRRIEVVCAGFPCQDISQAGRRVGIDGERSGLFKEILRILEFSSSVKYVFLENVPAILPDGSKVVTDSLNRLGFRCAHGVFQANETGAVHTRKRWFCLGVRKGAVYNDVVPPHRPSREPLRLVKGCVDTQTKARYKMLGNSVVPQTVAFAWNTLMLATFYPEKVLHSGKNTEDLKVGTTSGVETTLRREVKILHLKRPLSLPFGITRNLWATPTAQFNHPFHSFKNKRGMDNLFNQIFYEKHSLQGMPRPQAIATHRVNPTFLEWLMGYPTGYTKIVNTSPSFERYPSSMRS